MTVSSLDMHAPEAIQELSESSWKQMCDGTALVVRISNFASPEECAALVAAAERIAFSKYENVDPPIDRIGVTVFEHDRHNQQAYFDHAAETREVQRRIFDASFDPVARMREIFAKRTNHPLGVANDAAHGDFYAGLVRRIEHGTLLHVDWAPGEHSGWAVTKVERQFAWNLYAELSSTKGGATHVWHRRWRREDDAAHKIEGTYGYRNEVLGDAPVVSYQPTLGDVYIINTQCYHTVDPCNGRRTTVTSALGTLPGDHHILWS